MKKFAPRKYFGNTIFFYIFFGMWWLIGFVLLIGFFSNVGTISKFNLSGFGSLTFQQNLGLYFVAFASLVILVMLFVNMGVGTYYAVDERGITASKNFYKKLLPYDTIANIRKVNYEEVRKVARSLRQDQLITVTNLRPIKGIKSSIELMNLRRYSSVPITFTDLSVGSGSIKIWAKNLKTSAKGDFILLTLTDNKKHLLSPKDVDGFLSTISSLSSYKTQKFI